METKTDNAPDIQKQENGQPENENHQQNNGLSLFNQDVEQRPESTTPMMTIDLNNSDLPDLDEAEVIPLDLSSSYWTPQNPGESKRVYFDNVRVMQVQDTNDKEVIFDLPCVFFFEKTKGEVKTYCNGSKRLVAIMERNHIQRGTPVLITYLGKKRNSTNQFFSDDWSVKPLVLKIGS